jgi:hypothetical protein
MHRKVHTPTMSSLARTRTVKDTPMHKLECTQSVNQSCFLCGLIGYVLAYMLAFWGLSGGQKLRSAQRYVRGLLQTAETSDYPLIGEVPASVVRTGERFWLDVDQHTVPKEYRHDVTPVHYKDLPILFSALRSSLQVPATGTWASRKLRNSGLTPALLDSLPFNQAPIRLLLPTAQISTAFRLFGASFTNAMFLLQVVPLDELGVFNQPEAEALALAERGWKPRVLHTFQVRLPVARPLLAVTIGPANIQTAASDV